MMGVMINDAIIGNRVLIARTRAGMTQEQLARQLAARGFDLGFPTVSKIEKGRRSLKFSEAVVICDALSITLDALWGGDPIPVAPPATSEEDFLDGITASIKALQELARQHRATT